MSVLDIITGQLTGDRLQDLAKLVGANQSAVNMAVKAALPMIVGALAKNSQKPEGAEALNRAVEKDHDGSIMDKLGDFLKSPDTNLGDGILKHVLGQRRQAVEAGISQKSGVAAGDVGKILATLAPVVMGALAKKKREANLDADSVSAMLRDDFQRAAEQDEMDDSPTVGLSGLAGLLDADKDGSVADDLASFGTSLLSGFLGKK